MPKPSQAILLIICLALSVFARADSWTDPTWKRMLNESDMVALVQYTARGDFQAPAKILTIYKGQLKMGEEIWISGFSNRYGPVDIMHKGDKYLVFLKYRKPDERGIASWKNELKTRPGLKSFVNAYERGKVYYVWTPTSGDLRIKGQTIQYDLTITSQYEDQHYYPLKDFEEFLTAYYDGADKKDLTTKILNGLAHADSTDLSVQQLMKLYFLGFDQYDPVFKSYMQVGDQRIKYALAQLMGNIRSIESRDMLFQLLDDESSLVQGEAVRQLKNEPAEIVGPILLKHLKTASTKDIGSADIMNPVMNRIDGGQTEIIGALGSLNYKPAIAELLSLLDTKDEGSFKLIIESLKALGSRDYVSYINKHLDNKTASLMFTISMMIAKDSLTECLPSLKNFISTCDRNNLYGYEYTLSNCCGIGKFADNETISFLLADCERFFSFKDTLSSSKEKKWTQNYISTFADLKVKEARPLVYRLMFDWFGINEDFGNDPGLFNIKRILEDSVRSAFAAKFAKQGYKLNYCMAFLQNAGEIIKGKEPVADYLIEVTVSGEDMSLRQRKEIAEELHLSEEKVFIRNIHGWYFLNKQERFDPRNVSDFMRHFLEYISAGPVASDMTFLKAILHSGLIDSEYQQKQISKIIDSFTSSK